MDENQKHNVKGFRDNDDLLLDVSMKYIYHSDETSTLHRQPDFCHWIDNDGHWFTMPYSHVFILAGEKNEQYHSVRKLLESSPTISVKIIQSIMHWASMIKNPD